MIMTTRKVDAVALIADYLQYFSKDESFAWPEYAPTDMALANFVYQHLHSYILYMNEKPEDRVPRKHLHH